MRRQGFTLLEVVVAMAMLSLGLMAIFDLNSRAVSLHSYGKKLTVATLLARGQMIEIEQKLIQDGFSTDDDEENGDFSQEGWPSYKWRAQILAPKTQGMSPMQIMAGVLGLPMGEDAEGDPLSFITNLMGGGGETGTPGPGSGGANPQLGGLMGGAMAGLAQQQMQGFVDQITKTIREVHLTVYWQDGNQTEQVDLVTHVVSTPGGKGDRNPVQQAVPPPGVTK
jgi:general secretion pathway protein I